MEKNHLIEPENYFEGYNQSIENNRNDPNNLIFLEFDKLCYEIFENQEVGKRFIEIITELYLIPAIVSRGNPTYPIDILWQEGFKDFARMILSHIKSNKQRIKAETNK